MQINFKKLSIAKIIKLSKHIKEKCINFSSFEEVAQELMKVFYSSFVTEGGRSPFVLARFFKACTYGELPDDIRNYIHNKESKEGLTSDNKYLTLLGSFGELDNWKDRNLSENYKAFPIHEERILDKFPMLSAVFKQIGLDLSPLKQTDQTILVKNIHRQYGVFCVENAEGSKLIPKQAAFVRPYSVKSVFGFGGIYSTSNVYAVIVFSRERLSRKDAQLFCSLNPAIKQITLAHEITGNIFKTDRKDTNFSVDGLCDESPTVQIKSHNKSIYRQHKNIIEKEMALTSSIELEMANEYLLKMSEELKESHQKLEDTVRDRTHELNASKEQIQLLLDSTGEAIYGLDNDGNCNFANAACLRILRYKEASQLIGENMHDLIHHTKKDGTHYPIEECCIYQAFKEGKGTHVDDEVLWRADGTCFPVEYMSYPIRKDNKIIGAVITFSDFTERKKNEEEIKSLSKFPSENPNPVLRVDNKGTILFFNKPGSAIIDLWGLQVGQLIPKDWQERLSDVVRSGLSNNYEIKCNNHIFSITLAPVKEEGYVNFYGLDITDQKKMEYALIQSENLNSIGTIATGIAHEFNNILAIISGNVQLLELDCKNQNALRTIKNATDDGAEISSKMLKFAETGEDNKEIVSSEIRDMIKQSMEFTMPRWKNMAQINGIDYQMNTDGIKEIAPILCNPTEMREVFINIINNALDAMPDGGSLSFKTWSSKDTVFVSITDTGKGMTEDVMKNIYVPFFTTRRPEGTGLGMSIVYSAIKSHGGKIEVESEVGKGSTVTLQFPVSTETASPIITPGPEQEIKGRNLSILVVDDKEAICRMLDITLSKQGHKVKTFDNGADAIEIIKKENFDLVLCDLAMPNVSGYDVIKALHKLEMTPKIGIITGWGVKLKPVEEGKLKVDFILKKPFDFSELTKYINDVVFSTE